MSNWCSPVEDCAKRNYPNAPWEITNGFLNVYLLKDQQTVHTGDDINLNNGADIGATVRSIGDGEVIFAQHVPDTTWMGLVVIRHDHDGTFTCSRYAHLTNLSVSKGDRVTSGQRVGEVSDTAPVANVFTPHLHFDIGATGDDLLIRNPQHWPDKKLSVEDRTGLVSTHYQRPGNFLLPRITGTAGVSTPDTFVAPPEPMSMLDPIRMRVNIEKVKVRSARLISDSTFEGEIFQDTELLVSDPAIVENKVHWRQIFEPMNLRNKWVAEHIALTVDDRMYLVPVSPEEPTPAPLPPQPPVVEPAPAPAEPAPAPLPPIPVITLPPGQIKMRVNIEKVKIRSARLIAEATFRGEVFEDTELVVSNPATIENKIHWRQIVQPDNLRDLWVAERVAPEADSRTYLVAVSNTPLDAASTFSAFVAPVVEPETLTPPQPSTGPAPSLLTGRFKLTAANSPTGPITALAIDGVTRPALGVNMRELAYFGTPKFEHTGPGDRGEFCVNAKNMNMRWVRFFAAHSAFSTEEIVNHTRDALNAIQAQGMLAIVVFADSIQNINLFPEGDRVWHKVTEFNHLHKDYFNGGHYTTHYLPLVERLVTEFRNHPAVGMWQLMNEPAIYPDPASDADVVGFEKFVDTVSGRIFELDQTHPISIGIINTAHIMPPGRDLNQFARNFYANRKHIHVVTCHTYQSRSNGDHTISWDHEDNAEADVRAAAQTGRAVFWTEFGAFRTSDRRASTERFLNRHLRDQRASGALQWGFMIGPSFAPDKGVGDQEYGFSNAPFNPQFEELKQLFTNFVNGLG